MHGLPVSTQTTTRIVLARNQEDMYPDVNWAVPADSHILAELAAYDGWQTPKNLEINTEFSRQWIGQRCRTYVAHGLAERHDDDPAYRITDLGQQVVNREIDLSRLSTESKSQ